MAEAAALKAGRRRRGSPFGVWADRHMKWLLIAPAVILILALTVYPLVFSIWVAFVNYDFQIPGHAFVGLLNFQQVLADPLFVASLLKTAILAGSSVVVEFLLGLGLAMALVDRFRGRGIVMSILLIPLFISPVVVGQFWSLLLQRPFGPVDYLLGLAFGPAGQIAWLTQSPWNFVALITADVWQWTPFMFVILLSGLTSIDPELYEAAALDGATAPQTFFHVTVPQLLPIMLLALTLRLLDAIKLFDIIYVMTGGGPGASTYTTSYYLYVTGFQQFHLSVATAGSWIFLALTAVIILLLVRRLLRQEDD
jgi:multiple sugar transport system permease protein